MAALQRDIIDRLRTIGPMTSNELCDELGSNRENIRRAVKDLHAREKVFVSDWPYSGIQRAPMGVSGCHLPARCAPSAIPHGRRLEAQLPAPQQAAAQAAQGAAARQSVCGADGMSAPAQAVTTEQLARLYQARNEANKRMGQALRTGDRALISDAKSQARDFNLAYDEAKATYKRQQKAARRAAMLGAQTVA